MVNKIPVSLLISQIHLNTAFLFMSSSWSYDSSLLLNTSRLDIFSFFHWFLTDTQSNEQRSDGILIQFMVSFLSVPELLLSCFLHSPPFVFWQYIYYSPPTLSLDFYSTSPVPKPIQWSPMMWFIVAFFLFLSCFLDFPPIFYLSSGNKVTVSH